MGTPAQERPPALPWPGVSEVRTPLGSLHIWPRPLQATQRHGRRTGPEMAALLACYPSWLGTPSPAAPQQAAFLDIETNGFAGRPDSLAFCVGLGRFEPAGTLVVDQYLLSAPAQECAMLLALGAALEQLGPRAILCTFNGRTFDVPFLRARYVHHELPLPQLLSAPHAGRHVDLRVHARAHAPQLTRHALGELERHVLGLERHDDVPGREVPRRWKDYCRTGKASLLEAVLEHNRLDILSLPALLAEFLEPAASPPRTAPAPRPGESKAPGEDTFQESVSTRLGRSYALRARQQASAAPAPVPTPDPWALGALHGGRAHPGRSPGSGGTLGPPSSVQEYAAHLRQAAELLIASHGTPAALPILHEILALLPAHPFALEQLVRHHRAMGQEALAGHLEQRLRKALPY